MSENIEKKKKHEHESRPAQSPIDGSSVYPNFCNLSGLNYQISLGSFDVPMRQLLEYALFCMEAMREIEEEKK